MPVQDAIEWASPESLPKAAFTFLSFHHIDNRILTYGSPRTNSTQLIHASDGLWSELSRPAHNQGENLNDGLISGITGLVLAKADGDSEETSVEQQHNDATNAPDEEECPTGFDTLDCEDCGGPEHTWEVNPWHFHCKGIEEEGYKWKDCYCMNPDPRRGPCTFDNRADEIREDDVTLQEGMDDPGTDEDLEETSIEQQLNDATNVPDDEECPTGHDTLDCEECGGVDRPWGNNSHIFHCRGIEAEGYRWKDCYCMDFTDECGPCTFDYDLDNTPNDWSALEDGYWDSANETDDPNEASIEQQLNNALNDLVELE